jgi:fatty-acyl-CoA synthase
MEALSKMTVGDLFDTVVSRFPDRDALVDIPGGRRYSYRELQRIVNRLARGFLKLGVVKGEHLAIWTPNRCEYIIAELAAAKIGAVLVSIDTNAQPQQLEYLLGQSDSQTLILAEGPKGADNVATIRRLCPEIDRSEPGRLDCRALPELRRLILIATAPRDSHLERVLDSGTHSDLLLAERQLMP